MKILIGNDNYNAHYYERLGLSRAFTVCGHHPYLWDIHQRPANDVFDEFEPDIFIFQTYNLNRPIIECIMDRPHLKCIMKAGEWGAVWDTVDSTNYQVLLASEQEIENTLRLFAACNQPSYLYIYYHPDWLEDSFGYWMKQGLTVKSHLLAADIFDYTNGVARPEFKCDVGFVGGYWPYKARVFDEYLIPMCRKNSAHIRIFGNGIWPVHQYCGNLETVQVKDFLASAIVCPNLHEPHSQDLHRDMNERTFKLLSNKCFVVSDYVEGLAKVFNNGEVVFAHNPQEFEELILYYISHPEQRIEHIEKGYHKVLAEHTYLDRVQEIFQNLDLSIEADAVTEHKQHILKKVTHERFY